MSRIDPSEFSDLIDKAARFVAQSYGARFPAEDIAQAISQDMLENPSRYNGVRGNLFFTVLKRAGHRFCVTEISKYLNFADQWTYSSEELKQLLPKYFTPAVWPNGLSQPRVEDFDGDSDAFRAALEVWSGETKLVIDMMDLDYAFGRISQAQRNVLLKRYADGEKLSSKYELNLHGEAIRFLTSHVNTRSCDRRSVPGDHEGPGARRVISNEASIAATETFDDGGYDAVRQYGRMRNGQYPESKRSPHVVDSPWRSASGMCPAR